MCPYNENESWTVWPKSMQTGTMNLESNKPGLIHSKLCVSGVCKKMCVISEITTV